MKINPTHIDHLWYSYGYQIAGNGQWVSLTLKMPKQKGGGKKKKKSAVPVKVIEKDSPDSPDEGHDDSGESDDEVSISTLSVGSVRLTCSCSTIAQALGGGSRKCQTRSVTEPEQACTNCGRRG